jgi:hypothetical protein
MRDAIRKEPLRGVGEDKAGEVIFGRSQLV